MKNLFDAVEMNNLHLKNRLIRSATWEGIAEYDGSIDENTYKISIASWQKAASARLSRALQAFRVMIFISAA